MLEVLGKLLQMTCDTTYFRYNTFIYRADIQNGYMTPLSVMLTNTFMEKVEKDRLSIALNPLKFKGKYVMWVTSGLITSMKALNLQ